MSVGMDSGTEYYDEPESSHAQEPESEDPYEKLREAKELLDQGILTQEEFDAEKKRILG